ncbi:MAG: hypothetical protein ACK5DS_00105 [Burkholderiales bacterium]
MVEFLQFARAFNEKLPGFDTDVHGLVRQGSDYFVDCVKG